jgi:hypothetical protein
MPAFEEHERSSVPQCSSKDLEHVAASKSSTDGPQNPMQEISKDISSLVENQLVLYAGGDQQLSQPSRSSPSLRADQCIREIFERASSIK